MRDFFHCDTRKYITRRKYILWLTLLPLVQGAVIILLITIVNLRAFYEKQYLPVVIYAVGGAAAAGTLIFFAVFSFTEAVVKRYARYNFIEIGGKALIYSRYAGDYLSGSRLKTARRLYVVPLKALKSIALCEKSGAIFLEAGEGGAFRGYNDRTERLKYKLNDGFPEFESWWYNENGFDSLAELRIPPLFGSADDAKRICVRLAEAKRLHDDAPKPRQYVHKEPDFVKRKKALALRKKLGSD
jgi:hypothetical protein